MALKWASLAAFAVLVAVIGALALRHSVLAAGAVGLGVQIAAVLLMLWARVAFRMRSFHAGADPTEGGIVTDGPYRFLRHPIYAAILWFLAAAVLTHLSPANLALGALGAAALAVRIAAEERLLVERYPEYAVYAARTKRVVPFVL